MDMTNNIITLLPGEAVTVKSAEHGASMEITDEFGTITVKALPFDKDLPLPADTDAKL